GLDKPVHLTLTQSVRRLKKTSIFAYFPLFTQRYTFIVQGRERVPVAQLLPRPGLYLYWKEEKDPTEDSYLCISIRPEKGYSLK
ncbi:MAG: hypothetical protein J7M32_01510, partial [Deltaproteobacteria bacterium]|nr:hypothetical protein [Deltaproteobacteria bacterium]